MGAVSNIIAAAILATTASITSAGAGSVSGDLVHADSFGNLVIYGSSGYKRIVVGAGHLAPRFDRGSTCCGVADPDVVYLDERGQGAPRVTCSREPVVLHGRSYMYGLPQGAVVVPVRTCE